MTTETLQTETLPSLGHNGGPALEPRARKYEFRATRSCRECAQEFTTVKREGRFCSTECRKQHSNRRALRGAELYDLFMALRYERGMAKAKGIWAIICRLGQEWKEEDDRAKRQSWTPYGEIQASGRLTRISYLSRTWTRAGR
jgi:hypothetical protein